MGQWRDLTLGDAIEGLKRYQPFIAAVVVIVLVVTLLPGRDGADETRLVEGPGARDRSTVTQPGTGEVDADDDDDAGGDVQRATADRSGGDGGQQPQAFGGAGGGGGGEGDEGFVPGANCDESTGRIMVPTVYAPPCAPAFGGDNGGATYGDRVTADTIRIAVYSGETNAATQTILAAAGSDDSDEEVRATHEAYAEYFETHYETYGRQFEIIHVEGGEADDDIAAQATAREVIDANAFASIGGPTDTNVYMRELRDAGILCLCTVSQPIETYLNNAPYVWSTLMASTELYVHRAEYIGKRLWGEPAEHAGDPTYHLENRRFALVYFDTAEGTYTAGADFFEDELTRYGAHLDDRIAVTGAHINPAAAQQEAGVVAQRLRDNGITSVVFAGDPLYPIFLTQEATRRGYNPEWIITGSVLSDTNFFGRTYDQTQWANAFGVSSLSVPLDEESGEAFRVHVWHYGTEPAAESTHALIYSPWWILGTGVHMAGPNLNPETFRDGLFAYPPSGGGPTTPHSSFGTHIWEWTTYLRFDDMAEIWWDPEEFDAEDQELGMYRYVEAGRRYVAGEWPSTAPFVFDADGTVTQYDEPPAEDRWPEYPPYHEQQ